MSESFRKHAVLADVAVLAVALEEDQRRSQDGQQALDRRIAARVAGAGEGRRRTGLAWLEAMRAEDRSLDILHARIEQILGWAHTLLFALGLLTGWLGAFGALAYDGSHRINVLALLGLLVVLPGLFLLAFLFAALPRRSLGWLPGAPTLGLIARSLSPGRLIFFFRRWLPPEGREAIQAMSAHLRAHQTLYARLQKWIVLRGSQIFALGFQAAALSAALALIVFSDLAFGWSTTLTSGDPARDAERVHVLTTAVAAPWSWTLPAAEPSAPLVAESRYYRAAREPLDPAQAARLGGWWTFVIMGLLLYGLAPRLITTLLAHFRLRVAADAALEATPGLTAVLHRLHRARLATGAEQPEPTTAARTASELPVPEAGQIPSGESIRALINWSGIDLSDAHLTSLFHAPQILQAGGAAALAEDAAVIEQLAATAPAEPAAVAIAVKAWEPPLLEFTDFLRSLRTAIGPVHPLLVVPLALDDGHPQPPTPAATAVWTKTLAQLGDPWLRVHPFPLEVAS